jgi:hypothetical protein
MLRPCVEVAERNGRTGRTGAEAVRLALPAVRPVARPAAAAFVAGGAAGRAAVESSGAGAFGAALAAGAFFAGLRREDGWDIRPVSTVAERRQEPPRDVLVM